MDALGQREALLDSRRLDSAIAAAQIDQKAALTGQASLFDVFGGTQSLAAPPVVPPPEVEPAPASRERSIWEKEVLGFQFGDHPFMEAAAWLAGQLTHDTSQLTPELSGEKVKIAGFVTAVKRILTKSKSQMAVLVLEDLHGSIEAVVFPRVYERSAELFREDAILIVEGKVDTRSDRPQIVVDRAASWAAPPKGSAPPPPPPEIATARAAANGSHAAADAGAPTSNGGLPAARDRDGQAHGPRAATNGSHVAGGPRRVLRVVVPRGDDDNACLRVLEQLHVLVERFPGSDEIQLVLHDRSGGRVELAGADIPIAHSADLELQVRSLVGADNVQVVAQSG